jgi:hypothetical protein
VAPKPASSAHAPKHGSPLARAPGPAGAAGLLPAAPGFSGSSSSRLVFLAIEPHCSIYAHRAVTIEPARGAARAGSGGPGVVLAPRPQALPSHASCRSGVFGASKTPAGGLGWAAARELKLRAKFAPANTQTEAAVEAAARRTTGFVVVSAGLRQRPHRSTSTGAGRASARTARHGPMQARALEEPLQGLRHGTMQARDTGRATASKDCGTGCGLLARARAQSQGARRASKCKDCGTGHCEHGLWESKCKDCGTYTRKHGRQKAQ